MCWPHMVLCIISWKVQMATWSQFIRTWFDDTTCHQYHLPPKMAGNYQFIMYFPYYLLLLKHFFLNLKELDCKIMVLSNKKGYASVTLLVSCNKNREYRLIITHTLSGQQIKQYALHEFLFLIISILFLIITTRHPSKL